MQNRILLLAASLACLPLAGRASAAEAPLSNGGLLDAKEAVSTEAFRAYWRDAHGPLAARIGGIHDYWQHHLGAPLNDLFPVGVPQRVPAAERYEGLAEVTFASTEARASTADEPATALLMADEQNVFRGVYQLVDNGDTRTLAGDPYAPAGGRGFVVLLRPADAADRGATHAFAREHLGPALAGAEAVRRVRLHLNAPYDGSVWDTPNVENDLPEGRRFAAWLEVVAEDEAALRAALASDGLAEAMRRMPAAVGAAHAYPVDARHAMMERGEPTLAGLRGATAAAAIRSLGAENQASAPVLRLTAGAAAGAAGAGPVDHDRLPELPPRPAGDEVGAARYVTPAKTLAAAGLISTGKSYQLGMIVYEHTLGPGGRVAVNTMLPLKATEHESFVDDYIAGHLSVGTQVDGLGHAVVDGESYNGVKIGENIGLNKIHKLGVENIPPIATRGVLLDVAKHRGVEHMQPGEAVGVDDLIATLDAAGLGVEPGDVVLIRTGWLGAMGEADPDRYVELEPGLSPEAALWLAQRGATAVGLDVAQIDPIGVRGDYHRPAHGVRLKDHGVYTLENIVLDELAGDGATAFFLSFGVIRYDGAA